jgi:hypothetical protein
LIEERGLESDGAVEGRFGWRAGVVVDDDDELVRARGEPSSCGVRGRRRIREVMSSVEKRLGGGTSMTREERLWNI